MATTITGTTIDVGPNKLVANSAGNVGIGTASPSSKLTSESAAATNIVAKSTNGNGGYMNFQGLASNGTQTFGVNHNGTIFTTSGLAVGGVGASNTLDDYEEGTWTPTLVTQSGSVTLGGGTTGVYTKVGDMVYATGTCDVTAISSPSGTARISLPFTSGSYAAGGVAILAAFAGSLGSANIFLRVVPNGTNTLLAVQTSGDWGSSAGYILATTQFNFTLTYKV